MTDKLFLCILALLVFIPAFLGFRHLPKERWQMIAAIPKTREDTGWKATNITFYGFFSAMAYAFASAIFALLMGACGTGTLTVFAVTLPVLGICIPASRWVAILVEKKQHTFTVGGASFVGIVITPWVLFATDKLGGHIDLDPVPVLPGMAAIAIAYAFGEGIGRLACISFGCCYGKPVRDLSPKLQRLIAPVAFVFSGETKKIAYASGLESEPVVPIQAMTLVVCCTTGIIATGLFLADKMVAAFLLPLTVTQLWRVFSECFRADYRGGARTFSAYQVMALAGIPYAAAVTFFFGSRWTGAPILSQGFSTLWQPGVLLSLQTLWVLTFLYTGRSEVTTANVRFHVRTDRI